MVIDKRTWKQYSAKLPNSEALKVLREVIDYITEKLNDFEVIASSYARLGTILFLTGTSRKPLNAWKEH